MSLLMSANTCKIEVELNPSNDRMDKPAIEGMRFYVMCDSVDIVLDK
mgnify:CR=1 FL=1